MAVGRSEGNINNWTAAVPVLEGMLMSHNPVAVDEVTRIPKTKRTRLLASVGAYTLDRTRLSDSGHHVDRRNYLTSPSGIRGRA